MSSSILLRLVLSITLEFNFGFHSLGAKWSILAEQNFVCPGFDSSQHNLHDILLKKKILDLHCRPGYNYDYFVSNYR
jgi:hypothetical protein